MITPDESKKLEKFLKEMHNKDFKKNQIVKISLELFIIFTKQYVDLMGTLNVSEITITGRKVVVAKSVTFYEIVEELKNE